MLTHLDCSISGFLNRKWETIDNAITRVPEGSALGCLPPDIQVYHFKALIIGVGYKCHNLLGGGVPHLVEDSCLLPEPQKIFVENFLTPYFL